jgi:hypothetical protein
MPGVAASHFDLIAQRCSDEIEQVVQDIKQDRDNWKATAEQYKQGFETMKAHFNELRDICFAAQADLTNERTETRRLRDKIELGLETTLQLEKHEDDLQTGSRRGLSVVLDPAPIDVDGPSIPLTCANFRRVEQFASYKDFDQAIAELERLLRGPLSADARVEGLLLKSTILRAADSDLLLDALAACSEALEMCDRQSSNVKHFLSKIHYHRGLCYYRLNMILHAQDAFGVVSPNDPFYDKAMEYRKSCDEELDAIDDTRARTGFEEARLFTREMPAKMRGGESLVSASLRTIRQLFNPCIAITASSFKHPDQSLLECEVKTAVSACSLENPVTAPLGERGQCLNFEVIDFVCCRHADAHGADARLH